MSEIKLKPCPFCGGEARFATTMYSSARNKVKIVFKIECRDCHIELPNEYEVSSILNESGEMYMLEDWRGKAAEDWNRRVTE